MYFKENYANVKTLRIALKYDKFNWQVIGDFKMAAFLMGFRGGLFLGTFVIGIVEALLHTTTDEYGQNEPSFLLGKATPNRTL